MAPSDRALRPRARGVRTPRPAHRRARPRLPGHDPSRRRRHPLAV